LCVQSSLPADSRRIAETYYHLGVALGLHDKFDEAIKNLDEAIVVITKRYGKDVFYEYLLVCFFCIRATPLVLGIRDKYIGSYFRELSNNLWVKNNNYLLRIRIRDPVPF
jgi:hypothetical protein